MSCPLWSEPNIPVCLNVLWHSDLSINTALHAEQFDVLAYTLLVRFLLRRVQLSRIETRRRFARKLWFTHLNPLKKSSRPVWYQHQYNWKHLSSKSSWIPELEILGVSVSRFCRLMKENLNKAENKLPQNISVTSICAKKSLTERKYRKLTRTIFLHTGLIASI